LFQGGVFTNDGGIITIQNNTNMHLFGLLINNGTMNIDGSFQSQGGLLNNLASGVININNNNAQGVFLDFVTTTANYGIINNNADNVLFIAWTFHNYGTINNAGDLILQNAVFNNLENGLIVNTGFIDHRRDGGQGNNRGVLLNDVQSRIEISAGGSIDINESTEIYNLGTITTDGSITMQNPIGGGTIHNVGGTLDGSGTIVNSISGVNDCFGGVISVTITGNTPFSSCKVSTGGAWSTAGNWSPNGVPAVTDTILINGDTTLDIDLTGASEFQGILIVNSSSSLTLDQFRTLHNHGNVVVLAGGTFNTPSETTFANQAGSVLVNSGIINNNWDFQNALDATISNNGIINSDEGPVAAPVPNLQNKAESFLNNNGQIINSGAFENGPTFKTVINNFGSITNFVDQGGVFTNTGTLVGNAVVTATSDNVWEGGATGDWSNAANWSGGTPVGSDDIIINGGITVTLDISFTLTTGTLTIQSGSELIIGTNGSLTNDSTNTITINGVLTVNNGQTLTNTATGTIDITSTGTINNAGTIDNSGIITIQNSVVDGINNTSGTINNSATGTITISNTGGNGIFSQDTITNSGTITISNSGGSNGIINNSDGTLSNSGTITIQNTGIGNGINNFNETIDNNAGTINNSGTITISNTGGNGIFPCCSACTAIPCNCTSFYWLGSCNCTNNYSTTIVVYYSRVEDGAGVVDGSSVVN